MLCRIFYKNIYSFAKCWHTKLRIKLTFELLFQKLFCVQIIVIIKYLNKLLQKCQIVEATFCHLKNYPVTSTLRKGTVCQITSEIVHFLSHVIRGIITRATMFSEDYSKFSFVKDFWDTVSR